MRWSRLVPSLSSATSIPGHRLRIFLSFALFYVFLTLCARTRSSRDPGSVFFDPSTAYDFSYSAFRLEQAAQYVDSIAHDPKPKASSSSRQPGLCLGIPTIARKGVRYFKDTVGALLDDLDEAERADIHLILFIAHTDPSQHPAYTEPWLRKLADEVLLYNASEVNIGHLQALETNEAKASGLEKALFDYVYLLKACEVVDTPYIIMLEDDVVALDGWYHRTRGALASAEQQTRKIGASKCEYFPSWAYLTLCWLMILPRVIPPPFLHRRVPWLEFRRVAYLPLLLYPRRLLCRLYSSMPPPMPALRPPSPAKRNDYTFERYMHPFTDRALLRRRPSDDAPCTRGRASDAQIRLLLAGFRLPALANTRSRGTVRVQACWIRRHAHGGICECK